MEILYNFFEIIKGNNGTWAQAILNGLVLNIRVVFGLVVSIYFYKKIYNLKSFESLLLISEDDSTTVTEDEDDDPSDEFIIATPVCSIL